MSGGVGIECDTSFWLSGLVTCVLEVLVGCCVVVHSYSNQGAGVYGKEFYSGWMGDFSACVCCCSLLALSGSLYTLPPAVSLLLLLCKSL